MREASARWKQLKELEANLQEWKPSDKLGLEEELKRMRDYMVCSVFVEFTLWCECCFVM